MYMNKFAFLLLLLLSANTFAQSTAAVAFKITNPSNASYSKTLTQIPWQNVLAKNPSIDTANFKIVNARTQKEIPYQLEYLGMPTVQNLLVQVSVPAKESITIQLVKGKPTAVTSATYCRYVPERKEDFAWENDQIAFRMYGKELEKTPKEMAYGIDVWVKRVSRLILNERYKRGDYHVDHGDGLDYYHVGLTLGAGNLMPLDNDTICYSKNYTSYKILDNGPLRTTFQLVYDEWQVGNKKVKATKTISLDAGSQLNKITVTFVGTTDSLPVVAGIITRKGAGVKYLNESEGIMGYWEPQHDQDGTTGVACIMSTPVMQMIENKGQLLAKTNTGKGNTITYYAGAAWDKAGMIKDADAWTKYLKAYQYGVNNPLAIGSVK